MDELYELFSHAHIFFCAVSALVNVALPWCSETFVILMSFKPTEELRRSFCFKFYLVISKIYKVRLIHTFLVFEYGFSKVQ